MNLSFFGFKTESTLLLLSHDFGPWLGSILKNDLVHLLLFVTLVSPFILITSSVLSIFLTNVPSSRTLLLMQLLFSVSDMIYLAIFLSFRHFNVSCCDTFWRIQLCFDPTYSYPLNVTNTIQQTVLVVKCIALRTK